MVVPTEDEAAATENIATHGKKAPMKKAITGGEAASVKNVAANDPGGKKAPVQSVVVGKKGASLDNTTVEASGGKKVPRGKKAPVQSATVEASGGKKATVQKKSVADEKGDSVVTIVVEAPSGNKAP
jgi:hypothetical protein